MAGFNDRCSDCDHLRGHHGPGGCLKTDCGCQRFKRATGGRPSFAGPSHRLQPSKGWMGDT